MAEQQTYNYTLEDIQRYLNGGMNAKQMHEMERAALQDPFLADAIDGYAAADTQQAHNDLNDITAALQKDKQQAKVVDMRSPFGWLKIAAIVLLIIGAGAISWLLLNKTSDKKTLAKNEVVVAPQKDSVKANVIESKPDNDTEKAFTLTAPSTVKVKPKVNTGQNKIVKDKMFAYKKPQEKATAPIDLNRTMIAKQAPANVASQYDSLTAALTGKAEGLTTIDSSLKNVEASAVAKINSQDKKDTEIRMRGISSMSDTSYVNNLNGDMNEVVVIAMGRKKAAKNVLAKDSSSTPVGGWQSFQEYVYKKLNKPYDSTATGTFTKEMNLEFSINEEGLPYNFSVLQSQDDIKAKEAIDIIKNGPRWITADKKKKINLTLKY